MLVVLHTYRTFTTPEKFMQKLKERYEVTSILDKDKNLIFSRFLRKTQQVPKQTGNGNHLNVEFKLE
jgi:hypothetical protein